MKKIILLSAAAILAFASGAYAQDRSDHHGGGHETHAPRGGTHNAARPGGAPHAAHTPPSASAPAAAPAPNAMRGPSSNNAMRGPDHNNAMRGPSHNNAMRGPDHNNAMRGPSHNNAMRGPDHNNAMRGPDHNNAMRGPSHNNAMRGPGGNRNHASNFNSYHRNFNAPRRYHAPAYRRPSGWYAHRWVFGERLPTAFFAQNYWLSNYLSYGLEPPPYGTTWVRYGDDALLIDETTGEVIQVEYGVFY